MLIHVFDFGTVIVRLKSIYCLAPFIIFVFRICKYDKISTFSFI